MLAQIPWRIVVWVLVALAWLAGMFVDLMDVDAARMGLLALEMSKNNDFFPVSENGQLLLDFSPLSLWITAFSFKILGVGAFSFRLPAVLFGILAIWSTQKLVTLYHGRTGGQMAAILMLVSQGYFTLMLDVRGEMIGMGAIMFAIWQLCLHRETRRWGPIFWAFLGLGGAVLAMGPWGVIVPLSAVWSDRLLRRDFWGILNWRLLLGLPVMAALVVPFGWRLYANGGEAAVHSFFWKQTFEQWMGIGQWQPQAGPLYYVLIFFLAFMPWTLLFMAAFWRQFRDILFSRIRLGTDPEGIGLAGFFLIFGMLLLMRYQVAHSLFMVFPFAVVVVAGWLARMEAAVTREGRLNGWANFQFGMAVLLIVVAAIAAHLTGGGTTIGMGFIWVSAMLLVFLTFQTIHELAWRLLIPTALAFVAVNAVLNIYLFPHWAISQSSVGVGRSIQAGQYPADRFWVLGSMVPSLDFYARQSMPVLQNGDSLATLIEQDRSIFIYTGKEGLSNLIIQFDSISIRDSAGYFPLAHLNPQFLHPRTRASVCEPRFVIEVWANRPILPPVMPDSVAVDSMRIDSLGVNFGPSIIPTPSDSTP